MGLSAADSSAQVCVRACACACACGCVCVCVSCRCRPEDKLSSGRKWEIPISSRSLLVFYSDLLFLFSCLVLDGIGQDEGQRSTT